MTGMIAGAAAALTAGLVACAVFVLWVWVLVDILRSEFTGYNKFVWLFMAVFLPVLGVILYLVIGREQKIR
jgi:hypothetical protein